MTEPLTVTALELLAARLRSRARWAEPGYYETGADVIQYAVARAVSDALIEIATEIEAVVREIK
jgi:Mg2+ and Co2+ transporter CorA